MAKAPASAPPLPESPVAGGPVARGPLMRSTVSAAARGWTGWRCRGSLRERGCGESRRTVQARYRSARVARLLSPTGALAAVVQLRRKPTSLRPQTPGLST